MPILEHLWIIPLLPLLGAAVNGLLGERWPKNDRQRRGALRYGTLSFLAALEVVREFSQLRPGPDSLGTNIISPGLIAGKFPRGFRPAGGPADRGDAAGRHRRRLAHPIYSTGYMAHEGGYYRFFCYLNLFMFFMLTLVLAANYVSCLSAGKAWACAAIC